MARHDPQRPSSGTSTYLTAEQVDLIEELVENEEEKGAVAKSGVKPLRILIQTFDAAVRY